MNERIVCAANQCSLTGLIVTSLRHHDQNMNTQIKLWKKECDPREGVSPIFDIQGFVTNKYRFVDRQEAWKIAERNNQIIRRCGGDTTNGGTLYSENLY